MVQQGALFAYGKMPVGADFVLDALISLGLSRAFETSNLSITPFARVTWQVVTQSGMNEG